MSEVVRDRLVQVRPGRLLPTAVARTAAVALAILTVGHLVAQIAQAEAAGRLTQWSLMPLLAATLWCATTRPHSRLVRGVLLALALSWLGDVVPAAFTGDARFLVMVSLFLCAQIGYVATFWPHRTASLARRPPLVAPYVVAAVVLVAACAPQAPGPLLAAVVVYAVCLVAMAVLATGVHALAGIGGAVFLVSDAMIALRAFTDWYDPPVAGFWVMLTYVAGQTLIVAGVLARQ